MAKKLHDLMLKNDDNGRQIRCLVVEDYRTGSISKIRDRERFESILKETDEMFLTKIYEPTAEQRSAFLDLTQGSLKQNNKKQVVSEVDELDVLLCLLELTDLDYSTEETEENKALLTEIAKRPNALFLTIKNELEIIFLEIMSNFYDMASAYYSMPDEMLHLSTDIIMEQERVTEQNKLIAQKEAEIAKLQQEIEAAREAN